MKGETVKNGLTALAVEAKRRGTSYGKLVAGITPRELEEIVRKYEEQAGKSVG